jgi:asparagine synthase (glutamine-hydrolysing)
MNDALRYRGPDDEGVFVDPQVSLGHRRLSIIDLSPNGHQPMTNEDQSLWLTYNGEIYNFQEIREELIKKGHLFSSNTDSEVIIHAYEEYGLKSLEKFNGMWAFCLYDKKKEELILSRDQFGIKPLYYYFDENRFIFSSMIAGVLCHDIDTVPNDEMIMQYLAFNLQDHTRETFFSKVHSLATDSVLIFDLKNKTTKTIQWFVQDQTPKNPDHDEIRNKFTNSVRLRTISDVPIGSCLSGGVDSSAIVSILNNILPDEFNTYSYIATGSPLDESKYIVEVGKNTHTRQVYTHLDEDDFIAEIEDFVVSIEEPVSGLSPYAQYRVMKLAYEDGAKVLLDGQGGDELFAGYEYYFSYYFYELLTSFRLLRLCKELYLYYQNFKNNFAILMFFFLLFPGGVKKLLWKRYLNKWINHEFLSNICREATYDPRWKKMKLQEALSYTFFYSAIPHLLKWEDKNSMRWSIESRVPFFDQDLVSASLFLSPDKKIGHGRTKTIFKKALDGILMKAIKERKDKIGFQTIVDDLLRKDKIKKFCDDIIFSNSFKKRPYWNWQVVEKQYREHMIGKTNIGDTIWKWINVEMWLRHFFPQNS